MKKLTLLIFIIFHFSLFTFHSSAQSCLPEGITFTTQDQIDNFQINYPNCTEIEGYVWIIGYEIINLNGLSVLIAIAGDIKIWDTHLTSLTGLETLNTINGDIIIGGPSWYGGNDSLTSLTGLNNITTINGSLKIDNNDALSNLMGFDNLDSIGGVLSIRQNDNLTSLSGLGNVTSIAGSILIYGNEALVSLTGLESLTYIEGSLRIGEHPGGGGGNPSLVSLVGLENLTSIGGLAITYNDILTSLTGLDNIDYIGGGVGIGYNDSLTNLSALEGVTSINGQMNIHYNPALPSLAGLDNIDAGCISNINIHDNYSLSTCEVQCICDYLAAPGGTITIYDNAPGCNSQQEVEEACETTGILDINPESKFIISPNPLESGTTIEYTLYQNSPVTLKILDFSGRKIVTLVNEFQQRGEYNVVIDGTFLSVGIYFCVIKSNERIQTKKMIKL